MTGALDTHRVASFFAAIVQPLVLDRHPAAGLEDVTRRQGFASRCSRCADTGPGARVIALSLPPPGSVALVRYAQRSPAAAVAQLCQACLMPLKAAVVAAFRALDGSSALR